MYCCLVPKLCLTLCNPMDCSMPSFSIFHFVPEFAQTHVHWLSDTIQPSHPLSSPSPLAFNLSQLQGLFQWFSSSHQVAKVLELQHQSFQWIFGHNINKILMIYFTFFSLVSLQNLMHVLHIHHLSITPAMSQVLCRHVASGCGVKWMALSRLGR